MHGTLASKIQYGILTWGNAGKAPLNEIKYIVNYLKCERKKRKQDRNKPMIQQTCPPKIEIILPTENDIFKYEV